MNKKDNKKIILAILALISIFVWIRGFKATPKGKYKININKEITILPSLDIQKRQKPRTAYKFWRKDPFLTLAVKTSEVVNQESELRLTGIIYNKYDKYAIINDKIVRTGDKINSYKVIVIKQDRIILTEDGIKKIELKLAE